MIYLFLFASIVLNTTANLLLKKGVLSTGIATLKFDQLFYSLFKIGTNYFVWLGILCFVLSLAFWLLALTKLEVSVMVPIMSISYFLIAVFAFLFLGESLNPLKIIGILLIWLGVFLLLRS